MRLNAGAAGGSERAIFERRARTTDARLSYDRPVRRQSDRLRITGWIVLASGLVVATLFYVIAIRTADPSLDDVHALGYQRSLQHGMGVMMGHFGVLLTEWQEAVSSPAGEALIIVIVTALLAAYFFRVAWVLDEDERQS